MKFNWIRKFVSFFSSSSHFFCSVVLLNVINLYFVYFLASSFVPERSPSIKPTLPYAQFFLCWNKREYKRCAYPLWILFYSTINKGMKITHGDATPGSKMKTKTYLYIFVRSFIRILSDTCFMFYVLFIYHCIHTFYMKHYVETSYCFIASIVCIWYR